MTDDAEQQIPVRTSSPELDRQRFSGAPKVGDASAPLLLPSSTKRSVVDEQRNAITKRSDRPPPPATRPRFAFAGAASVVAIGALVAGVAWRGHRVGANATSAPSAVTPPPGCTSNHACVQAHGGEPWMCRASDKQCVAIDSTDCHARADEGALNSDETFWIGEMYALGQPEGQGNDRGTELARQDFAQLANALRTNERHARPLALVACDDGTDPRRAARHLVDDLHVPAIVGFSSGSELLDLATSVLAPNDVLAIATLTSSPLVTQLPRPPGAPPLVWRTTYGLSEVALAASTVIATTLEPEVHSAGASHVRIALLRTQSAAAQVLADRFFDALRFNGQSALDNGSDYRDVVVDTKDASTYASAIVQLLDLRPQIVLYFGGEPLTENVIVPVEKAWPASERVRPRYLAASVFDPQALHVAERNASTRHRFFGLTSLSGTPVNARFAMHFNQVFGTDASRADVPSTAYDAFYVVAYASFALGRRDISGTNLARAMSRLVTPGSTIDVGPSGILQAFTTLTTEGQSIDLNGAGGTLDFDLESGEHEADLAVLCVNVDKAGRATGDIESGLVYRARAKVLTGRMRCP